MADFDRVTAQITAVLSMYPYLDIQRERFRGETLGNILRTLEEEVKREEEAGRKVPYADDFRVLLSALNDPEMGPILSRLRLVAQSHYADPALGLSGKDHRYEGDNSCVDDLITACAFQDDKDGTLYVAYRGTGDGKWLDNGEGFSQESTDIQLAATRFFDDVYSRYGVYSREGESINARAYVTGHSKGGNEAQFVLMTSRFYKAIQGCYSFDGQGFSQQAIDSFRELEEFDERLSKLYSINGAQDPVHNLLIPIALAENVYFVDCGPLALETLRNVHDMKAMFTNGVLNWMPENDGHGTEGLMSIVMRKLNQAILEEVDPHQQHHIAMGVMALVELFEGAYRFEGVDDAEESSLDYLVTFTLGLGLILKVLVSTEEGRELLSILLTGALKKALEKIPGFTTIRDRVAQVLQERRIHSWDALWEYIGKDPIGNTLDLLSDILGDWETLGAVVQLSASIGIGVLLAKAILAFLTILRPVLEVAAEVLVCLVAVKLAVDFLREHWEEIRSFCHEAVDFVRRKISEMVNFVVQTMRTAMVVSLTSLFRTLSETAQRVKGVWDTVKDSLARLPSLAMKAIDRVVSVANPLLNRLFRTAAGATQQPVMIDRSRLEKAVSTMERLAVRVQTMDTRLDRLYSLLCEDSVEQGEGIFTSLAKLYHLMQADINVDQGGAIVRKAKALRALYTEYSDVERWLLSQLGG